MFYGISYGPSLGIRRPKRIIKVKTTQQEQDKSIRKIIQNSRNQFNSWNDKENKISLRKQSQRFSEISQNDKKIIRYSQIYQNVLQPINKQFTNFRNQPRNSAKMVAQDLNNFTIGQSIICQRPQVQRIKFGLNENKRISQSQFNLYKQKYSINSSSRTCARTSNQIQKRILCSDRGNNYHINLSKKRSQKMASFNGSGTSRTKNLKESIINQQKKLFKYESKSIKGTKQINQDTIKVGQGVWIVCDGHGQHGHDVSWYAANMLFDLYHEKMSTQKFSKNVFRQIFIEVQRGLQQSDIDISLSGSTCVMVVHVQQKLYCACLGDSVSIAIYDDHYCQTISSQHKPSNPQEAKRIQFFGGVIKKTFGKQHIPTSPLRLWGNGQDQWGPGLAISRSFGDKMAQKYGLIYEPQVKQIPIDNCLKFVVLGSDGLFDQVKHSQMATILNIRANKQQGCRLLTEMAQSRWMGYSDDISGVVIYF